MAYYGDFRDYLKALEERGKLTRIKREINKDTQLHPVVRLQYRGLPEEERNAFLFENVIDSRGKRYQVPVAISAVAAVQYHFESSCFHSHRFIVLTIHQSTNPLL